MDSEARYPEVNIKALAGDVDHILLSTEPFAFRKKDIQELTLEIEGCGKPKISLINGEMTAWYGSSAIQGFDYLKSYRSSLISG